MTTDRPASPHSANAPAAPTAATLQSYSKQDATTTHALIQFSYSSVQITQTGTKSKTLCRLSCNSMKDFSWKAAEKMPTLRILPQMDSHTCTAPCKHTLFCMSCKQQLVQASVTRRCPWQLMAAQITWPHGGVPSVESTASQEARSRLEYSFACFNYCQEFNLCNFSFSCLCSILPRLHSTESCAISFLLSFICRITVYSKNLDVVL